MKQISSLFLALPEIIKLVLELIKYLKEAKTKTQIKEDVRIINEAFSSNNADELNKLFNYRTTKKAQGH